MSPAVRTHLALLGANLLYGGNYSIAKIAMPHPIAPFGFIAIRVICAVFFFHVVHWIFIREKVSRQDLGRLFLCGVFGVALNQLSFFKGLSLTTPINASLMMITTPIAVLLIASLSKVERLTVSKISGILCGAAGAALIILNGQLDALHPHGQLGDIFVLINATSYAVYLTLVKPLMARYHPLTVVKWAFTFGLLFVLPAGGKQLAAIPWHSLTVPAWLSLAYVVIGATFFTYLLNVIALTRANPSLVGTYIYLQPLIAATIALTLGQEELNVFKIGASALIFAGVYLVSLRQEKRIPIPQ
ncbi:MAG: multidrug transporter [Chitinophagales bacterium]|nr:MAG: multidrug transporter [Chitinophagales bacterium]